MFTVNGNTFQQGSAFDHATSMLNYMNSLLQQQNLPTLQPNNGNALWWTLLGQGSFASDMDQIVVQATASLNVAMCDDSQVINLLPIAGTSLLPATSTVVTLTAIASSGTLTIPSGTLVPYGSYNFATLTPLSVSASGLGTVQAFCTQTGPITVPQGAIYRTSIPGINNLSSITNNYDAIPGSYIETPAQARARIIAGKNIGVGIDGAITALRSLPGVGQANVYWNPLTSGYLPMSGLQYGLPPRTAWIVVQNNSPDIATTYLQYMNLPTSGANFNPANTQNYSTKSGQLFPIKYDYCSYQQVFATVYVDQNKVYQNGYQTLIQNVVTGLNSKMEIGQRVSSEFLSLAFENFTPATILGVLVSIASGTGYGQATQGAFNKIPFFTASGVYVVLQ